MSTAYAAHADLTALVHAREDVEMLVDLTSEAPNLFSYPVSGDALALVQRGTTYQRRARRQRARAERLAQ